MSFCDSAIQFITANKVSFSMGALYGFTAFVATMPPPGTPFNFYEWFYDLMHVIANAAGRKIPNVPSVPSPNESTPQEKK